MSDTKPYMRLEAETARVLANLKQGEVLENSNRYEFATMSNLAPVESLLHDLAEGPTIDLSRQDEFRLRNRPNHARSPIYVVNQRGRLWRLSAALDKLDQVQKSIPVSHLSPYAQALDRVFLTPGFNFAGTKKLHDAVEQAVCDVRLQGSDRPKEGLSWLSVQALQREVFSEESARQYLATINQYLRSLSHVLKHSDVRRAQRLRQNQAKDHYQKLKMLFRKTLKFASPALMVYLDLEGPNPEASSDLKANYADEPANENRDAYQQLNKARKAFLKPRNHDPLFHGLISYAWKYRYSYGRGLTCMMVLFFDAKRQTQRYSLTHALGAHWESVAGDGSKYSSPITDTNNPTQEQYFGLLDAEDPHAQKGLEVLAGFMGLYQLYVKPTPPKYMNTFDTSRMPGVTPTKRKPQKKR